MPGISTPKTAAIPFNNNQLLFGVYIQSMLHITTETPPKENGLKRIKSPVMSIITPSKNNIDSVGLIFFVNEIKIKRIQEILNTPQIIFSVRPVYVS